MYKTVSVRPIRKVRRVESRVPDGEHKQKKPLPDVDDLIFADEPYNRSER